MVSNTQDSPQVSAQPSTQASGSGADAARGPQAIITNKKLVLEELRKLLDKSLEATEALERKFQTLLGSASLVITLFTVAQLSQLRPRFGLVIVIFTIIIFLLYATVFLITFWSLRPRERKLPVTMNWDVIEKTYFGKTEDAVLNQFISDYLYSYQDSKRINYEKANAFSWALVLFALIILALLVMIVLSFYG